LIIKDESIIQPKLSVKNKEYVPGNTLVTPDVLILPGVQVYVNGETPPETVVVIAPSKAVLQLASIIVAVNVRVGGFVNEKVSEAGQAFASVTITE
jgi:hypothetical protein